MTRVSENLSGATAQHVTPAATTEKPIAKIATATGSFQAAGAEEIVASSRKGRRKKRIQPVDLRKGSLLQVFASLIWLPQAGLMAYAINQLATTGSVANLILIVASIFLLGLLRTALQAAGERIAFTASRQALSDLRAKSIAALAARSPLDRNRAASGQVASILAEQAEMVVAYWSRYQPVQMKVMTVPFVFLAAVFWYSWAAALVLLIAAPLIPIFMALIGWRAKAASEEQLVEMGQMNGFLLDRLRGLATIRTFHAVDLTAQRLRNNAETLRHKTMIVLRIAFLSSAVLELFSALGVAMVAVYIGFHLLGQLGFGAWGELLTLGQGLFILLLAPTFFEPLRELSAAWHDRAAGEAAIDALENISAGGMVLTAVSTEKNTQTDNKNAVTLSHIDFSYDEQGEKLLLNDFNLAIAKGEHVALLGPSGSGKSTLLALMAGLVAPRSGDVFVNGTHLNQNSADNLRQQFSWVGQKPHIFSGTVRANITLGREGYDLSDVQTALQSAALDSVASASAATDLGENGTGLSGGEGLRLALARAALKTNADIVFADEPTAHLDSETAAKTTEGLLALAQGKTLIIATHDEELAQKMGRIIRFEPVQNSASLRIDADSNEVITSDARRAAE